MIKPPTPFARRALSTALAVALSSALPAAFADERSELEELRATTQGLIDALVEGGIITRDKADLLRRRAEEKARERMAAAPAAAPETGRDGKRVVRVPYVPESTKREMREQIKQEVLAQAKEERWGNPGALPDWLDRFHFEGDLRLRAEQNILDAGNAVGAANASFLAPNGILTRGADLIGQNGNPGTRPNVSTAEDFSRLRLRARFGATMAVASGVNAGFRLSTGATSSGNPASPGSPNQTLGQGFNRYSVFVDRAWISVSPLEGLTLSGGRIANPFMGSDLVWNDTLSFEGVAARYAYRFSPAFEAFATAGWFPLRDDSPLQRTSRHLTGTQAGFTWRSAGGSEFKLAAALYDFHGVAAELEADARFNAPSASDYATRFEYPNGVRQRGNTLFSVLAPTDFTNAPVYGLASGFRPFNLTAEVDLGMFDPVRVVLSADYVKNLAYDRVKMAERMGLVAGTTLIDGGDSGFQAGILVGQRQMKNRGDWNLSMTHRRLGSDAVLDAFTASDFGLGGTNNKGFILGANYAIEKNTWVTMRWLSSRQIDSSAPRLSSAAAATSTRLNVDTIQVDLNARF